jgi:hypothetical protein
MLESGQEIVLSIKPAWIELIMSVSKTVELRRHLPCRSALDPFADRQQDLKLEGAVH